MVTHRATASRIKSRDASRDRDYRGSSFDRFRPLVDLHREAGRAAGHAPETLRVGFHAMGFVSDTDEAARGAFFPSWAHMFTEIGRERS